MQSVLKEILEEQKTAAQITQGLGSSLKAVADKLDSFEQKLKQQKVIAPPLDTRWCRKL